MKRRILFSAKNKKNISKCPVLKILPRVLSVKPKYVFLQCYLETVNGFRSLLYQFQE